MSGRELTLEANAAELQALAAEVAWNRAIEADKADRTGDRALDAACGEAMRKAFAARATAGEAWRRAAAARRE